MENQIFEAAFGLAAPWFVQGVNFDADRKLLGIQIDFVAGSRFVYPGGEGTHPVHDTQGKRYRHLNFFQHECYLEVRVPRLQLPDGRVVFLEPEWAGNLSGFTLLFGDLILMLARQMPFAAVARLVGESWQRVQAICAKYVHLAVDAADLSAVEAVAIDETSLQRGHAYLTLVADARQGKVLFVTKGRDATTLKAFAQHLPAHRGERTADHVGEPRYVAGLHQGRDERSAPSSHHLRPVSCHRSRLDCSGQDVSGRRETRSDVKVIALDLAQGSSPADDQAHCPDLVVPGTLAGDSGSQTDPCRVGTAASVEHTGDAIHGGSDEDGRPNDSTGFRWDRGVGTAPPNQWLARSCQRVVPGGQTQGSRVYPAHNHAHRDFPDRWKTRFPKVQPLCDLAHSFFKKAENYL